MLFFSPPCFVIKNNYFVRKISLFDKKYEKNKKKTGKMLAGIKVMCIFAAVKGVSGRVKRRSGCKIAEPEVETSVLKMRR